MANEFIVRKGLIVEGASGGTVVDIQGSQGQLFSVTDDLSGSIFAVSDISGVPIFDVNSSGVSYFDGKVGIGTAAPTSKLHVQGSATSGNYAAYIHNASGGGNVLKLYNHDWDTGDFLIYATNGGTAASGYGFTVDGNARVNIGLSTVAAANAAADDLHLKSLGSNGITISSGNSQTGTIFFGDVANSAAAGFRYNHNTGDMAISAEDNITFACDNVGIGTTSPGRKLTVQGADDGTMQLRLMGTASQTSYWDIGREALSTGQFRFIASRNGTVITPMVIDDQTGNVGIGISAPTNGKLVIDSTANQIAIETGTAGDGRLNIGHFSNGTFIGTYGDDGGAADLIRFGTHSGDERMRIDSSGEVLVNVTSNQTESPLTSRNNGSSIEFGHLNQTSGYYGTVGSMYNNGTPFISFSCDSSSTSAGNNFATRGFKGNVIHGDTNGNLIFSQATNANSASQALTERMRIDSSGNVGIGTTDPDTLLNLEGAKNTSIITLGSTTNDANWSVGDKYGAINFYSGDQSGAGVGVKASISYEQTGGSTGSTNSMVFRAAGTAAGTNNTERMRIDSAGAIKFNAYGAGFLQTDANGNITAGTVTTSDTLDDVTDNGSSTTNSITVGGVTSTGGGEMQGGDLYFKNGGDDGAGTHLSNVWYSVSTGGGTAPVGVYESAVITTVANGTHGRSDLVFKTKDNDTANFGTTSERMRIESSGNVGIGITNPAQRLEVGGKMKVTDDIILAQTNGRIDYDNGNTSGALRFWSTSGGSERMRIDSDGKVGIGTTNPATLLHLGKATNGTNIISLGEASIGGPHGLDFYGDDATRTKKFSIYYRTGTENISMEDGSGTKRWEISQSGAVTFNQAFTFPTADGSAGAALVTNGSGALSWGGGYQQYSPVGWTILNNQTYTSTGANISSSSTQAQAGTTPVQRNSATEFEATKQGWYEISYSFIVKNNYTNRAMIGAYMTASTSTGGGVISGSHSTDYVRYNTYGEYAQIQNTFYYYTAAASTDFYLLAYLLSGSMNMTTQSINQSMISFRYINNDIT